MTQPLFSTYTQGENRVTGTIMAVFERINSGLVEDILAKLVGEPGLTLLEFETQLRGESSVPDGAVRATTAVYLETKTTPWAIDHDQLQRHLQELEQAEARHLLVLTPDTERPVELDDTRVAWANFDTLVTAIEEVLDARRGVMPTQGFLLRELVRFIEAEGLTSGREDRVLVVAARRAWSEYQAYGVYCCQPDRSFKPAAHLAFYADGEIKPSVPRITAKVDSIRLTTECIRDHPDLSDEQKARLLVAVQGGWQQSGEVQQVVFLEPGVELDAPVENDKTACDSDQRVAFVRGHRYISFSELEAQPESTTALE